VLNKRGTVQHKRKTKTITVQHKRKTEQTWYNTSVKQNKHGTTQA
jgi:ribosomal protein S17